jgi:hypothetical protein
MIQAEMQKILRLLCMHSIYIMASRNYIDTGERITRPVGFYLMTADGSSNNFGGIEFSPQETCTA